MTGGSQITDHGDYSIGGRATMGEALKIERQAGQYFTRRWKPHGRNVPDPTRWRKRQRALVDGDPFDGSLTIEQIDEVFTSMLACEVFDNTTRHDFLIVTAHPGRMREYFDAGPNVLLRRWGEAGNGWMIVGDGDGDMFSDIVTSTVSYRTNDRSEVLETRPWGFCERLFPLPNVWLGCTVEDQRRADERIPELLKVPAAVRFLSCEPLLGPVDLRHVQHDGTVEIDTLTGDHGVIRPLRGRSDAKISWVIVGGESGPKARPMEAKWAASIKDQCVAAGTPFFFKRWGDVVSCWNHDLPGDVYRDIDARVNLAGYGGPVWFRVGKKAAGRELDDQTWDQFPTTALASSPDVPAPGRAEVER
jgi:protein gp37